MPLAVFLKYHLLSFLEAWFVGADIPFFDAPVQEPETGLMNLSQIFELKGKFRALNQISELKGIQGLSLHVSWKARTLNYASRFSGDSVRFKVNFNSNPYSDR